MPFNRFKFSTTWLDAVRFPTLESNEAQVRQDMQALHDETKDGLNQLMGSLESAAASTSLGARDREGSASTVQAVLDAIHLMFSGVTSVTATLGDDDTTIPTSKAVNDALTASGSVPSGGGVGQVLVKNSEKNYDMRWESFLAMSAEEIRDICG